MPEKNVIVDLSFQFALAGIAYAELLESQHKFVIAKQFLKSATSIGANVSEAQNAESKADFIHKMKIAAKECDETIYWLRLCMAADTYPNAGDLLEKATVLNKILTKIISTSKIN
jgi:four helix bundle protein